MMDSFNHFDQVSDAIAPAASKVVRKVALDIVAGYQTNAPRDTGFMANSAYMVSSQDSTYGQGGSPTHKDSFLLPEVDKPDDMTAYAAVGANYGYYVEMGSVHGPAQPAFYPAVDSAKSGFEAAMNAIIQAMNDAAK